MAGRGFLDPLYEDEVALTQHLIRKYIEKNEPSAFSEGYRFSTISLYEPPKSAVLPHLDSPSVPPPARHSLSIILSISTSKCYEVICVLTPGDSAAVFSFDHVIGVHPSISSSEYEDCEALVRADPEVAEILRTKYNITDMNCVMVDLWTAGANYSHPLEVIVDPSVRLGKPLLFYRENPTSDNPVYSYSRPIEGIVPVIDLIKKKIIAIEIADPLPPLPGAEPASLRPPLTDRPGYQSLLISQPEGPSWKVDGWQVSWLGWNFRVGFNAREGAVINLAEIYDFEQKKSVPVLYRMSVPEMVVPYGDATFPNYRKNAFDAGEEGMGVGVNSLGSGCDCLGKIHMWDVALSNAEGEPRVVPNGICLHEEDAGVFWKHTDWRGGSSMLRRNRRLVVSFWTTVANYDYGFYYYFYLDGTITVEVKMSGIINSSAKLPDDVLRNKARTDISPYGVNTAIHQHLFCVRVDWAVGGWNSKNRVTEINVLQDHFAGKGTIGNENGNGFYASEKVLQCELEARRNCNEKKDRFWKIESTSEMNRVGKGKAYAITPGKTAFVKTKEFSSIGLRAKFLQYHLWVTKYHHGEIWPAGGYPNQWSGVTEGPKEAHGLEEWIKRRNCALDGEDLVTWFTLGATHLPRLEDWPVMPVMTASVQFNPFGFFDWNPSLDLPAPKCKKDSKL